MRDNELREGGRRTKEQRDTTPHKHETGNPGFLYDDFMKLSLPLFSF